MVGHRILIPLDGSGLSLEAIPVARGLATPDTTFILMRALLPLAPERGLFGQIDARTLDDSDEVQEQEGRNLRTVADRLAAEVESGQSVTQVVVAGEPAEEILLQAQEHDADLIVMASRGRGALGRVTFGGIADRIAREAPLPVLIWHPREGDDRQETIDVPGEVNQFTRIVVPLDGSARAAQALPAAVDIAKRLRVPLLLISAIDPPRPMTTTGMEPGFAAGADVIYRELEADVRQWLTTVESDLAGQGLEIQTAVPIGAPGDAILAQIQPGDLIVMTSRGQSGFKRFLFGSITERLVRSGNVPVLLAHRADTHGGAQ